MKNKYCCDKFSFINSGEKNFGINIRIIKLSKEFIERGQLDNKMIFLLTDGYEKIDECKRLVINYCPFCGTKLDTFYFDEIYIQEEIDL